MQDFNITCPHCIAENNYIIGQLEAVDEELKKKVVPKGRNRPLPQEPTSYTPEEKQINEAIKLFESLLGEDLSEHDILELKDLFRILLAKPVRERQSEEEYLYEDYDSDWEWKEEQYEYYNTEEDLIIGEEDKDLISVSLIDLSFKRILNITTEMVLRNISLQEWFGVSTTNIQDLVTMQYMFGVGGKNTLTDQRVFKIGTMVKKQREYFRKFAEEIKEGELSGAQVLQRIQMYGESVTEGYEVAKAHTHRVEMPEYPADGTQDCFTKCRCRWVYKDDPSDEAYIFGYWKLNPRAEHCDACLENSRQWNPIRVPKQF